MVQRRLNDGLHEWAAINLMPVRSFLHDALLATALATIVAMAAKQDLGHLANLFAGPLTTCG